MFEGNTYERILERMLGRIPDKYDKREGSVIYDSHSPAAMEIEYLYIELERIINESYGDTASREFLILRCKERGITPYPAAKAVLKATAIPAEIDITGKRFNLGELNYLITEKICDGEFKAECETEGKIGGSLLGELIPIDYVQGLEKAELTDVLIPGEDEEDTEDLRKRYFNSFDERAFGGNVRDYLEKTNAISGVGQTKVTRVWNGDISPKDIIPNNEVSNWCSEALANPDISEAVKSWLKSVFNAAKEKKLTTGGTVLLTILNSDFMPPTGELLEKVQTEIDPVQNAGEGYGLAPIGHVVTVKAAEGVKVEISAKFIYDTGYSFETLKPSFEKALENYFAELRKGWGEKPYLIVRISQIETRLLSVKGVVDITAAKINGSEENLTLAKFQVPILGEISEEILGGGENE